MAILKDLTKEPKVYTPEEIAENIKALGREYVQREIEVYHRIARQSQMDAAGYQSKGKADMESMIFLKHRAGAMMAQFANIKSLVKAMKGEVTGVVEAHEDTLDTEDLIARAQERVNGSIK